MIFAEIDTAGWVAILTAAISGVGAVILQALQMILSYKRDTAIKHDVKIIEKQTNGDMTKHIAVAAAEVVVKVAEKTAENLVNTATAAATAAATATAIAAATIRR